MLGSSTVLVTGSFGWQYNASNGAVFVGISARILVCVYTFQHWQFFLCACGAVGRQQGVSLAAGGSSRSRLATGRAARVYYNSSTVPVTGSVPWADWHGVLLQGWFILFLGLVAVVG